MPGRCSPRSRSTTAASEARMEVGFIGLGKMGRPMSERLLAAGFSLHVHNRPRGAGDDLAGKGAKAANSARGIAGRAGAIFRALPTPGSVGRGYREVAPAARQGQV